MNLDMLIEKLKEYNPEAIEKVKKAYEYAYDMHKGQVRQSGEPYIIHPLNVAYILANLHADCNTICAGLLHDTLEDTKATKEELEELFGSEVAKLVDGVTKISKLNFLTKADQNNANTKKILMGIQEDVRIIIIKLADRLHNMRTLQYKSEFKQKENSMETLKIFVPLSYRLGEYDIRNELEDLSLSYIKPDEYKRIEDIRLRIMEDTLPKMEEVCKMTRDLLTSNNIPNEVKTKVKNIYGIYTKLEEGLKLNEIHDLKHIIINVETIGQCYTTLGLIHDKYKPLNDKFKDFICNPKQNGYQSIHTTQIIPGCGLVQSQIRTFDMDEVATKGITAAWHRYKGDAREVMQQATKEEYKLYETLYQIDKLFKDNEEFVNQAYEELLSKEVYVYTPTGEKIELPLGSTPIDFAYKIHTALGNTMVGVKVNDEPVAIGYILKDGDIVEILTKPNSKPKIEWLKEVKTAKAKRRILENTDHVNN